MQVRRKSFYPVDQVLDAIISKLKVLSLHDEPIDFLTIVPEGEPTLDKNLGKMIRGIKKLGFPIAVFTNASLLGSADVRMELNDVDWLSIKMDTVDEDRWRAVNRPLGNIDFSSVLNGIKILAAEFNGILTTQTMLLKNCNDDEASIKRIAEFLVDINPTTAYLSVPTRPPALAEIKAAEPGNINMAFQIFQNEIQKVELLIGYEGNDFSVTGDPVDDILSITAVHPVREDAMKKILKKEQCEWSLIDLLVKQGKLVETEYEGNMFYMRKFEQKNVMSNQ